MKLFPSVAGFLIFGFLANSAVAQTAPLTHLPSKVLPIETNKFEITKPKAAPPKITGIDANIKKNALKAAGVTSPTMALLNPVTIDVRNLGGGWTYGVDFILPIVVVSGENAAVMRTTEEKQSGAISIWFKSVPNQVHYVACSVDRAQSYRVALHEGSELNLKPQNGIISFVIPKYDGFSNYRGVWLTASNAPDNEWIWFGCEITPVNL